MGLFDRIKGDTEEVELQVPQRELDTERNTARRTAPRDRRETEQRTEDDEERFLLPGMSSQAVQEPEKDEARAADGDVKELLGRIVQQNERIIRLLEDGEDGETDAGIDGIL